MIKSQCTDPEHIKTSYTKYPHLFSDRDSRDEAIALREEIKKRNNAEQWEYLHPRLALSKAASLYYCSEFNKKLNEYINMKGYSPYRLTQQESESSVYQRQGKN